MDTKPRILDWEKKRGKRLIEPKLDQSFHYRIYSGMKATSGAAEVTFSGV